MRTNFPVHIQFFALPQQLSETAAGTDRVKCLRGTRPEGQIKKSGTFAQSHQSCLHVEAADMIGLPLRKKDMRDMGVPRRAPFSLLDFRLLANLCGETCLLLE